MNTKEFAREEYLKLSTIFGIPYVSEQIFEGLSDDGVINTDLVARDHEEQSAEDTASQRDQDQDSGPQSAGDQHSGEPELRHHNDCQVCRVFTCQQGS